MPRQHAYVRGTDLPPRGSVNPVMPTLLNTGPGAPSSVYTPTAEMDFGSAIDAGGATNKKITGLMRLEDNNGQFLGQTFNFTDCWFPGQVYILFDNGTGLSSYTQASYPTVNLTRCRIDTSLIAIGAAYYNIDYCSFDDGMGMVTPCPNCAGVAYSTEKVYPFSATNSYFRAAQGIEHPTDPNLNEHSEGIHIAGTPQGMSFYNCTMIQEGPLNNTQTAALFHHGGACTFDWCWFHSNGTGIGAPFAIYSYGLGTGAASNVFTNCRIRQSEYQQNFYPITSEGFPTSAIAVVQNCVDMDSGTSIPQPTT